MRIARPCYDKYRRCPGWAGGGWKYAKVQTCKNGYVLVDADDRWWAWKFHRCNQCGTYVLPYHAHWLFPSWWRFKLENAWERLWDRLDRY